ncbi:MAG: hypothetical protein WA159_02525 [Variovorax sp.]
MNTPALKRGESAERVRKALAEATRPLSITEIIAATGTKSKQVTTLLSKWTAKQAVIRYGTQGRGRIAGYTYTIGPKTLRTMTYDRTPEETAHVKRSRVRACNRNLRAAGKHARQAAPSGPSAASRDFKYGEKLVSASTPQAKTAHETVADFIKRGGRIEKLQGFQRDHVVAPRRPVVRFVGRL